MSNTLERAFNTLKSGNAEERAEAVTFLGDEQYAPAVPYLAQLVREGDPGTRYLAAQALSKIGDEAESAVTDLLVALRFDDMFLRMAATAALINIGHPAVPGLVKALFDDNKAVRRASAMALGKIGSDRAIKPLEVACKDSDAGVSRFAKEAIERIQEQSA